jgi:hypothetical protein
MIRECPGISKSYQAAKPLTRHPRAPPEGSGRPLRGGHFPQMQGNKDTPHNNCYNFAGCRGLIA